MKMFFALVAIVLGVQASAWQVIDLDDVKTPPGTTPWVKASLNAAAPTAEDEAAYEEPNFMDSEAYDPNDENIEAILEQYDRYYKQQTGENPWLVNPEFADLLQQVGGCSRQSCAVWIHIVKRTQTAYFYLNGSLADTWPVSTARTSKGWKTKNWDGRPNGRIFKRYSSKKYPGGDYQGLGNMPYAVFYYKGFALHGTPKSNWKLLGKEASHGCVRMHPDNAKWFNASVVQAGIQNSWITVE